MFGILEHFGLLKIKKRKILKTKKMIKNLTTENDSGILL